MQTKEQQHRSELAELVTACAKDFQTNTPAQFVSRHRDLMSDEAAEDLAGATSLEFKITAPCGCSALISIPSADSIEINHAGCRGAQP